MTDTFFGVVIEEYLVVFDGDGGFCYVQADELGKEREAKQTELDAACEVARQKKLTLVRAQYVEECVENKQRPDRKSCEAFLCGLRRESGSPGTAFLWLASVRESA